MQASLALQTALIPLVVLGCMSGDSTVSEEGALRMVGFAAFSRFPPSATKLNDAYSKADVPLLSWRVQCLGHLDNQTLLERFDLTQPWDGDKNNALLDQIPAPLQTPGAPKGYTSIFAVKGPLTGIRGPKNVATARDWGDPLGETVCMIVAKPERAVPWTKPADLDYDPAKIAEFLDAMPEKNVMMLFFNGRIAVFKERPTAETMKALVEINDGTKVDIPYVKYKLAD